MSKKNETGESPQISIKNMVIKKRVQRLAIKEGRTNANMATRLLDEMLEIKEAELNLSPIQA